MTAGVRAATASAVQPLRALLRQRPGIAATLLVAALLLRVLVPAGFMPMAGTHGVVLTLCSGYAPVAHHATGMHHAGAHHADPHDEAPAYESRCAFADLALPVIGGAAPVLLAASIAFVMALALQRARVMPPGAPAHLRPPLRGPPLPA